MEKENIDKLYDLIKKIPATSRNKEKIEKIKELIRQEKFREAIDKVVNFYKIPLENICVIYDDMDIEPGQIKIRKKGSAGSHNGMKSVISELNSMDFARIRIGIGRPKFKDDNK